MDGDPDDIIEIDCRPCCGLVVHMRRENLTRLMRALSYRQQLTGKLDFRRTPAHVDLLGEMSGRDIGDLARAIYVPPS